MSGSKAWSQMHVLMVVPICLFLSALDVPFMSFVNSIKTCKVASEVNCLVQTPTETLFYLHMCTDSISLPKNISEPYPHIC